MSDQFLELPPDEQAQILNTLSLQLGRTSVILEKDIWICWLLEQLFSMPNRLKMAFKGGTSLSKVFNMIQRFSEDVDLTIDYRDFNQDFDPFNTDVSKTQIKKFNDCLRVHVKHHTYEKVIPHLRSQLNDQFPAKKFKIKSDENGEKVYLYYPSVIEDMNNYVGNHILLEFGGRNITEPNTLCNIQPDIALILPDLIFPVVQANVLSVIRTFWEKATLIHALCNQIYWKDSLERKSRHWYDLAMLAKNSMGEKALLDKQMLMDVVKHKNIFFHAPHANYSSCLIGNIKLVPQNKGMHEGLKADFKKMLESGMFYGKEPVFNEIIEQLGVLEKTINHAV